MWILFKLVAAMIVYYRAVLGVHFYEKRIGTEG
jgi:hypothetical protein